MKKQTIPETGKILNAPFVLWNIILQGVTGASMNTPLKELIGSCKYECVG